MTKIIKTITYKKVCSSIVLHKAWNQIYENGLRSNSRETRSEISRFKEEERSNIDRIYRQLFNKKFDFKNNKGIMAGKKKKRPVVLAPVESRIVQRAILDVLQSNPEIEKFLRSKGSYGAIKSFKDMNKGVPAAIYDLVNAINSGATTYYKSDIKSFFTQISRAEVIKKISATITDQDFLDLLEKATNLEVSNISLLPEKERKFFKFDMIGTPQGCCLSPLLGNILLYEFDNELNRNGITCLRYLDDFILLGKGWKNVKAAFDKAIQILDSSGLSAYTLNDDSTKAKSGNITDKFEFLGVEFKGNNIRPNKDSRTRLLKSIEELFKDCVSQDYSNKATREQQESSLVNTLYTINNKLLGWGNQYYFCNDEAIWGSLDAEVDELLKKYLSRYNAKKNKVDIKQRRRMLGMHLISDSKKLPLLLSSSKNEEPQVSEIIQCDT